jgi:DICT domain-containing protein
MSKKKNNIFHDLIEEVRALTELHNPIKLLGDLHMDMLDGEYHFTTSLDTLLIMSRIIEDTLKLHKKRCSLYSGFQEMSKFEEHRKRYTKLADYADQIFVVGIADLPVKKVADNVHIMTRNADMVRDNWISIINDKDIHISLIAEEVSSQNHHERYVGFYTNSKALTDKAVEVLISKKVLSDEVILGKQRYFNI